MSAAVVILAAGRGTRVGADRNKVLLPLAGRSVLAWSVRDALASELVDVVVVVTHPGEEPAVVAALSDHLEPDPREREVVLVPGGPTRHQSEQAALGALRTRSDAGSIDVVAFHDGARPLAGTHLLEQVIGTAADRGGALPVVRLSGLITRAGKAVGGSVAGVQTPQAFRTEALVEAYQQAAAEGFEGTDTASCLERYTDVEIVAVPGSPANLKVTFAEDLDLAAELMTTPPGQRPSG